MNAVKILPYKFAAAALLLPSQVSATGYISSMNINGNEVSLTIETKPGARYQIRGCNDLAEGEWADIGPAFEAGSSSTNHVESLSETAYWYRVVELKEPEQPGVPPDGPPD